MQLWRNSGVEGRLGQSFIRLELFYCSSIPAPLSQPKHSQLKAVISSSSYLVSSQYSLFMMSTRVCCIPFDHTCLVINLFAVCEFQSHLFLVAVYPHASSRGPISFLTKSAITLRDLVRCQRAAIFYAKESNEDNSLNLHGYHTRRVNGLRNVLGPRMVSFILSYVVDGATDNVG